MVLLDAAASSPALQMLDVRGAPLCGAGLEAARRLILCNSPLQTLRVTAATPHARDVLEAAAARAQRALTIHVSVQSHGGCRLA